MTMPRKCASTHLLPMLAMLASLLLGLMVPACADQQDQILPSLPAELGGVASRGAVDGGDARDTLPAGGPVLGTLSDAGVLPCDLLAQQYCVAILGPAFGCYPAGGAGRCVQGGGIGQLGSCLVDTDCNPGLLCEVLSGPGSFGLCKPICNLTDPTSAICVTGETCRSLDGFQGTNVGRCSSS